ncbi:hypothetical protein Q0590_23380 [Rhodocytophaga aerolata]|uniref:PAS domain-containing protein n=1 Tax=Rhodocytophaga aerolata TaxID=455078 RepID=A0ABT8RB64_9BACT|nr:hypothetical protein [Rhodocytophaga aerolata]MDO1449239.1 hypothetical protein [Rhodocytophaga aerolata]
MQTIKEKCESAPIVATVIIYDHQETLIYSTSDNKDFYNEVLGDKHPTPLQKDVLVPDKEITIQNKKYRIYRIAIEGYSSMTEGVAQHPINTLIKIYVKPL